MVFIRFFKIAERQRLVCRKRTDDSEPQAFVNQAIEIWRRALLLTRCRFARDVPGVFDVLSYFAVDCLATVFPHDNRSKQNVQPAKARGHKPVGINRRAEQRDCAEEHKTQTHDRNRSD